jgi:predicted transcriptional regulator
MSTTSLKLSDELKQRAETAAQELGISPHAFMVGAIRQAAEAVERRTDSVSQAQAARADMTQSGTGYDAEEVRTYLRQRLRDKSTARPVAKKWRE